MPTEYADFHLTLIRSQNGYSARVTTSPMGQATAEFVLPFSEAELQRVAWRSGTSLRHLALVTPEQTDVAPFTLQEFGARLFDTVFAGNVGKVFFRSLDEAERNNSILRVRLQFDDVPELAELPWEYLYIRDLDRFLVLSTRTPLTRYLALPLRERTLAVSPPLRILAVLSDPKDVPRLEVEQEWAQLNRALSDLIEQKRIVLDRLDRATLAMLRKWLLEKEVNILHFIGHGYFVPERNEGGLVFENDAGGHVNVTAEQLATVLHDHTPLRLVFLNACQGASSGSEDSFAGVAQKLGQQGVPVVLAMQFAVSDRSAIALAHEFYQAVAHGLPVDSAVSEARKALYSDGDQFEWGTPVLFSRSPDGRIVDVRQNEEKRKFRIWLRALAVLAIVAIAAVLSLPFLEPIFYPSRMTSGMNIAITEFGQVDESGRVHRSDLAYAISEMVFNQLGTEYQEADPKLKADGLSVEIWHDSLESGAKNVRLGVLDGATEEEQAEQARKLAEKINADIVIYGNLVPEGDQWSLHLDFYYYARTTLRGEPDPIAGRHVLGEGVSFPMTLADEPRGVVEVALNDPVSLRTRVLFWLTVALIHDLADQHEQALATLQEAQQNLAQWKDRNGQALLYYSIGREAFWLRHYDVAMAALQQATSLKADYVNAYVTLGATYYDRAQLFYLPQPIPDAQKECISVEHLDRAAKTPDEAMQNIDSAVANLEQAVAIARSSSSPSSEFPARLALGHAYRLKGQAYLLARESELAAPWFDKSLQEFQIVEQAFTESKQSQYLAWTYLGKAVTYYYQAFINLADFQLANDQAIKTSKREQAVTLFKEVSEECQRCLDEGKAVADVEYQKLVLQCGCEYLQRLAQDTQMETEKLTEEQ
jgi:tetratricopeptide (TPR) repeat protein